MAVYITRVCYLPVGATLEYVGIVIPYQPLYFCEVRNRRYAMSRMAVYRRARRLEPGEMIRCFSKLIEVIVERVG